MLVAVTICITQGPMHRPHWIELATRRFFSRLQRIIKGNRPRNLPLLVRVGDAISFLYHRSNRYGQSYRVRIFNRKHRNGWKSNRMASLVMIRPIRHAHFNHSLKSPCPLHGPLDLARSLKAHESGAPDRSVMDVRMYST